MRFPINQKVKMPLNQKSTAIKKEKKQLTGLGDVVATVAEPIKNMLLKLPSQQLQQYLSMCNCQKRKEWLNEHFPIKHKQQ